VYLDARHRGGVRTAGKSGGLATKPTRRLV